MNRLVQLVADYGPGDLAYAELIQRLALAVPSAVVHLTRVAPADTIAAGFCVAQLALTDGPPDRVVAHDVSSPGADVRLCAGRSPDGVWIVGPNSGWSWSFTIDELPSLCHVDVTIDLALAIAHITKRHPHAICDPVARASVPAMPEQVVAYIDGLGNVKTTIAEAPAASGATVQVGIGRVSARAVVRHGDAIRQGELALAIGSSGWTRRRGGRRSFLELIVGGGSAADLFARPIPGTRVRLRAS
jgi:hypothetical protein